MATAGTLRSPATKVWQQQGHYGLLQQKYGNSRDITVSCNKSMATAGTLRSPATKVWQQQGHYGLLQQKCLDFNLQNCVNKV
jgi:hypothetical protein